IIKRNNSISKAGSAFSREPKPFAGLIKRPGTPFGKEPVILLLDRPDDLRAVGIDRSALLEFFDHESRLEPETRGQTNQTEPFPSRSFSEAAPNIKIINGHERQEDVIHVGRGSVGRE